MRVFVSVGTHPQQFDRLLKELDFLVESGRLKAKVFAQIGNSGFEPKHFPFERFLSGTRYEEEFKKADVVVSHGGAGTIINALRHGKKLVVVPRLKKFGEHTNDHQLDLAKALAAQKKCIAVFDIKELGEKIALAKNFRPRLSSTRNRLVARVRGFIESQ